MSGLAVYLPLGERNASDYLPFWVEWMQQHYPSWTVIDLDSRSDKSFFSYVQKARAENECSLFLIEIASDENAPLGGGFFLLQSVVRERPSQTSVILQGRHSIVEKMGAALSHFYRTDSAEETKEVIHSILGEE